MKSYQTLSSRNYELSTYYFKFDTWIQDSANYIDANKSIKKVHPSNENENANAWEQLYLELPINREDKYITIAYVCEMCWKLAFQHGPVFGLLVTAPLNFSAAMNSWGQ